MLFWPRFRRALLASLSLVNVSLSCLHSIHFVSLHSPSQYLSCFHSSNPCNPGFLIGGDLAMSCLLSIHFVNCFIAFKQPFSLGFWIWSTSCLACAPSTLSHSILLHIISDPMQKKKLFFCIQAIHFSWDCAISFLC